MQGLFEESGITNNTRHEIWGRKAVKADKINSNIANHYILNATNINLNSKSG